MPSQVVLKVKCDEYLIKFLETLYGPSPINFPKNSHFINILDLFLEKPPLNHKQPDYGSKSLEIQLPFLEVKDVRSYNFLSETKQRIFRQELWKFFRIQFTSEISKCICLKIYRKDAIELFMEKYNLPIDSTDMLEKAYQRFVKMPVKKRLFRNNKNSSVVDMVCPANA